MSVPEPVIERSLRRRISNAWQGTKAAQILSSRKGFGKVLAFFSYAFWAAAWGDLVRTGPWKAVYPRPLPETPREKSEIAITSFALHIHPATIPRRAIKFSTTYGLGGLSAGLFFVLLVTGVLLMFYYVPATDHAYANMVDLQHVVSLGRILRNMHRWSAHAMVVVVSLHMLRVFIQRAYKSPRQLNWIIGVICLVFTLLLSFTGYLLPWDQLALWAVTVGTNMAGAVPLIGDKIRYVLLGGDTVDQATLLRFFVLHVIFLPVFLGIFMGYHFWRVRKDGFSGGK